MVASSIGTCASVASGVVGKDVVLRDMLCTVRLDRCIDGRDIDLCNLFQRPPQRYPGIRWLLTDVGVKDVHRDAIRVVRERECQARSKTTQPV